MSGTSTFLLLVNPHAGAGRARQRLPELVAALRECGASFETSMTSGPGEATRLARNALRDGLAGVAVIGGDGTCNEALNGFFDERGDPIAPQAWLGPLPCGTGGDFRRTLGIPRKPNVMATRLMWARPRPIDVGWLRFREREGGTAQRAFLNIASFGLGGLVDDLVNRTPKWFGGTASFLVGTLRALASYDDRRVRITLDDGEPRELDIVNVAVANGRCFGGGMRIAPRAEIDDGLFDVVSIEAGGLVDQARLGRHLYRGTILGQPGVRFERARRVVAEPADWAGPVLLDVDGEAPGALPASFEIRPGALQLRA